MINKYLVFILPKNNVVAENLYSQDKIQRIVEGPVNTTAYVGDTVILKCHVENQEGTVQWLFEGFGLETERDLPMFSQFRMVESPMKEEYDLEITNVIGWDDGFYECDEVRLICNVNSKPEHSGKYTWYHNNELLKKATKKVLYIEHLIPDDHNSRFTCRVNNALGSGSNTILLNVKYEPKFISSSQVKIVNQNEMAKFYCETHGNPKPRIYWRKSGDEQIIHKDSNFIIKMYKNGKQLNISDLQVRANDTVFVNHESIATLSCEFHGYPKPGDIIWTFNGENIITGRPSKRKKKTVYRLRNKKHVGDIQVECAAVDDITFASEKLLLYKSINQNNPDLDFNDSYGQESYQSGYPVAFITTDTNSSQTTTILRYDCNIYDNNTTKFCSNDRNKFINMKLLREIVTADNESGTPLLISLC
ncbi:Poly-glutamine tract binding protein 1 [Strongyloides ratti]|uniref:Poly-glutamine tract binding protein 1 n=1 Tax=Strongyloides ratti TaxID=34506 RepID=A0A090LN77_STRRB|nr:Poly-glutamine tract binding protein 1 [Strongyloides ratti]CEF71300.2 Poly-glutamine tract binding protein 1 [Strongyloides ratti]